MEIKEVRQLLEIRRDAQHMTDLVDQSIRDQMRDECALCDSKRACWNTGWSLLCMAPGSELTPSIQCLNKTRMEVR